MVPFFCPSPAAKILSLYFCQCDGIKIYHTIILITIFFLITKNMDSLFIHTFPFIKLHFYFFSLSSLMSFVVIVGDLKAWLIPCFITDTENTFFQTVNFDHNILPRTETHNFDLT